MTSTELRSAMLASQAGRTAPTLQSSPQTWIRQIFKQFLKALVMKEESCILCKAEQVYKTPKVADCFQHWSLLSGLLVKGCDPFTEQGFSNITDLLAWRE